MKFVHTQGVVLRTADRKESDRLLTVLSPELGRILVLARGCRKPKSKFLSCSQLFSYGDLILQSYRDIYIMNQAEVRNSFFDIRSDMERLSGATYIANLTEEVATTGESNFPLFRLLLAGLSYFAFGEKDLAGRMLIYELKLMDLIGYRPVLGTCVICGNRPVGSAFSFRPEQGGLVCENCRGSDSSGIPISRETSRMMQKILDADIDECFRIFVLPGEKEQMNRILPAYIEQKLEKKIKSRDFLKSFFI